MEARDINQYRITVPDCPEGEGIRYLDMPCWKNIYRIIESAFELIDFGANAAFRERVGININKNIAS